MNRRTILQLTGIAFLQSLLPGCERAGAGEADQVKKLSEVDMNKKVSVKVFDSKGELVGPLEMAMVVKTDAEWKAQLTADQYKIARGKDTERAFCGRFFDNHKKGVYTCICCGLPLFSSDAKFDSGTGWPSFFTPVAKENVVETVDDSHGMERKEILCARCGGHLGHVFDDGPRPTGLRFCVNSESMSFTDSGEVKKLVDPATTQPAK